MALGKTAETPQDVARRGTSRYRITITSIRPRLVDEDNLHVKATIDALVRNGVVEDDDPRFIETLVVRQEKGRPARTIIEVEEVE